MKVTIKLGKEYQDKITGFKGIATARSTFLSGCSRILLEGKTSRDGKLLEYWFDETRMKGIKLTKKEKVKGGPQSNPTFSDPKNN